MVKNPPAVLRRRLKDIWVRSLSGEDPLQQEMATHSSILAWRIPWVEESLRLPGSVDVNPRKFMGL